MTSLTYVDASALAKLILTEPDSPAMTRWYVETERAVTSRIGLIETRRALARRGTPIDQGTLDEAFATLDIVELDAVIAQRAAAVGPAALRTLDAVHLATALEIGAIDTFVTYDDRLADAARLVGLPVVRPA